MRIKGTEHTFKIDGYYDPELEWMRSHIGKPISWRGLEMVPDADHMVVAVERTDDGRFALTLDDGQIIYLALNAHGFHLGDT